MTETSPLDARRLTALRRVIAAVPSPDGRWIAACVERLDEAGGAYAADLWRVPLDGAAPWALTRGDWRDEQPCFRADGALGFLSDRPVGEAKGAGHKRRQVWLMPAGGGEPGPLTDEPLGVSGFAFARKADVLVVKAPMRPGVALEKQREVDDDRRERGPSALRYTRGPVRHWDHWLTATFDHLVAFDGQGQQRRDLTPEAGPSARMLSFDLSDDGRLVALTDEAHNLADRLSDRALHVIEVRTGARRLIAQGPRTTYESPRLSPDGGRVAAVKHVRSEARMGRPVLCVIPVEGGPELPIAGDWDRWPSLCGWSEDGRDLIVTADDAGLVPVFKVDTLLGDVTRITAAGSGGSHSDVVTIPGHHRLVGLRSRFIHPPEPFVVDLIEDARPSLVASLSGFSEEEGRAIAQIESRAVTSTRGQSCQSFLLQPARSKPGDRHPALIWIHGGPMGQWADAWHWRWNPLVAVEHGFVVSMPNPTGSTGFGQQTIEGIWGNTWGEQCYDDVMDVADDLQGLEFVDKNRMGAMGGSFGGYMTNWIGVNTDRFKALVTHASIYDMAAFHGVTDAPPWWVLMMGGLTPWDNPAEFCRHSPHRLIQRWKTPALIIHGERDFRVPVGEALALFEALQAHDVPSELLIFPDENHWILKPRNIVAWYEAVMDFMLTHLG